MLPHHCSHSQLMVVETEWHTAQCYDGTFIFSYHQAVLQYSSVKSEVEFRCIDLIFCALIVASEIGHLLSPRSRIMSTRHHDKKVTNVICTCSEMAVGSEQRKLWCRQVLYSICFASLVLLDQKFTNISLITLKAQTRHQHQQWLLCCSHRFKLPNSQCWIKIKYFCFLNLTSVSGILTFFYSLEPAFGCCVSTCLQQLLYRQDLRNGF